MRRTTHWAVFRSMNQQPPALRSIAEPSEPARTEPDSRTLDGSPVRTEPLARPAPDTRRDRVDLM